MSIINVLSIKQVIVFNEVEHGGVTTVFLNEKEYFIFEYVQSK